MVLVSTVRQDKQIVKKEKEIKSTQKNQKF